MKIDMFALQLSGLFRLACLVCIGFLLWEIREQLNELQTQLDEITGGVGALVELAGFKG